MCSLQGRVHTCEETQGDQHDEDDERQHHCLPQRALPARLPQRLPVYLQPLPHLLTLPGRSSMTMQPNTFASSEACCVKGQLERAWDIQMVHIQMVPDMQHWLMLSQTGHSHVWTQRRASSGPGASMTRKEWLSSGWMRVCAAKAASFCVEKKAKNDEELGPAKSVSMLTRLRSLALLQPS